MRPIWSKYACRKHLNDSIMVLRNEKEKRNKVICKTKFIYVHVLIIHITLLGCQGELKFL